MLRIKSSSYNLEVKIIISVCLHIVLINVLCFSYCLSTGYCIPLNIVNHYLTMSLQSVLISFSFILYSINCRLKNLVLILSTTDADLHESHGTYKFIVDLAEAQKTAFDPILATALLYNIPSVMTTIYYIAVIGPNLMTQPLMLFEVFESLVILFSPALCAGLFAPQTDKLKVILHNKLMETNDEAKIQEIQSFIRYVEARDCRFRLYKVIPLDADLLSMVLHFCVTYLIVIIQFTNQ